MAAINGGVGEAGVCCCSARGHKAGAGFIKTLRVESGPPGFARQTPGRTNMLRDYGQVRLLIIIVELIMSPCHRQPVGCCFAAWLL